jgi:hypothetical protein
MFKKKQMPLTRSLNAPPFFVKTARGDDDCSYAYASRSAQHRGVDIDIAPSTSAAPWPTRARRPMRRNLWSTARPFLRSQNLISSIGHSADVRCLAQPPADANLITYASGRSRAATSTKLGRACRLEFLQP